MELKIVDLKTFTPDKIRNFSIIAHIDHGKSTLADRFLELTGVLSTRHKNEQFLDKLQVEKERGITVKAQTASMAYKYKDEWYLLNLIDTPGHVDFSYEVSRSLYACQGAVLLVDAAQGVQAQTMANFYLAFEQNLTIIPVINKIDAANSRPEVVSKEMLKLFDFESNIILKASGKTGLGVTDILDEIVKTIPAPDSSVEKELKALLFDSWFNDYKGVVCLIAIKDGIIKKGDKITLAQSGKDYEVLEIGVMSPDEKPKDALYAGQVGYLVCGMKTVQEAKVGDTLYHYKKPVTPFPGFKVAKPMVFASIFPVDNNEFDILQDSIYKLTLNDASVKVEKRSSVALGLGFQCGFLGLLHMDVFKQRLEQEYNLSVIITAPSVRYKIKLTNGDIIEIESPSDFPEPQRIETIYEPMINATLLLPAQYLGNVLKLCHEKRGVQDKLEYLNEDRIILKYLFPLNEIATDFYDDLKSLTSGYASLDYEEAGYKEADLIKLNILLNGKEIDPLASIVHREAATSIGRELVEKTRKVIPRQLYVVVIQAAIGTKIIARETISALRKDVISKCYGGDITRKKKLLEKQKEGKKEMKRIGEVDVPKEAFVSILRKG